MASSPSGQTDRRPVIRARLVGAAAVLACLVLGIWIRSIGGVVPRIDASWMGEIIEHRSPAWTAPALFFNYAGGGVLLGLPVVGMIRTVLPQRRSADE